MSDWPVSWLAISQQGTLGFYPALKEERLTEGMTPWHCALSLVATKERLKTIDRPLFGDFWERFVDSLKALRDKQQ